MAGPRQDTPDGESSDARPGIGAPPKTLAEKVDLLFRTVRAPKGGEYSYEQVAKAVKSAGGPTISASYLWLLRQGQRDNPTMRHLEALANFFGVPAGYFFDDELAASVHEQLAVLALLRDHDVRKVALRASGLSRESLSTVTEIVDRMRMLEGLPEETDLAGSDERRD